MIVLLFSNKAEQKRVAERQLTKGPGDVSPTHCGQVARLPDNRIAPFTLAFDASQTAEIQTFLRTYAEDARIVDRVEQLVCCEPVH